MRFFFRDLMRFTTSAGQIAPYFSDNTNVYGIRGREIINLISICSGQHVHIEVTQVCEEHMRGKILNLKFVCSGQLAPFSNNTNV